MSESLAAPRKSGVSENFIAATAYITFLPALYYLIIPRYNKSSFIRFHAWQSLILDVFAFLISVVLNILVLPAFHNATFATYIVYLIWFNWAIWIGLWVTTAFTAFKGKKFKIWIIGNLAAKQAGE